MENLTQRNIFLACIYHALLSHKIYHLLLWEEDADLSWDFGGRAQLGVVVGEVVRVQAVPDPAGERLAGAAGEAHGDVEPVDHRQVVVVLVAAERELRQRQRRPPGEGRPATAPPQSPHVDQGLRQAIDEFSLGNGYWRHDQLSLKLLTKI
uniref:Uncharacterized protein n=1 Tax=Oryza brachyantha TaxID=4533 RepID=J3NF73_ORYBR